MAMITLPAPLRPYADRQKEVAIEGGTVRELLDRLTTRYPELRHHLMLEDGSLRSFVNIYLNDEDIRYLDKERTKVGEGDLVSIVPSIAGGCTWR